MTARREVLSTRTRRMSQMWLMSSTGSRGLGRRGFMMGVVEGRRRGREWSNGEGSDREECTDVLRAVDGLSDTPVKVE